MKSFFFIILFGLVIISTTSAQNSSESVRSLVTMDVVTPPSQQIGNSNYLVSLSEKDFNSKQYVFYTDSNATVAHLSINGISLRLTGGYNPENIMAYTGSGYTVTLSTDKRVAQPATNSDDESNFKIAATLVIYDRSGQTIVKKVMGSQINRVKN
jgi:hypothetical protein